MKKIVLLIALVASMSMHAQIIGTTADGQVVEIGHEKPIGPVHREIAESSPVARLVIEQVKPQPGMVQFKIAVHATLQNTSEHELVYVNPQVFFDVRNGRTNRRAPDTPAGCYANFFSKCYTPSMPHGIPSTGLPKDIVPATGSIELKPLAYLDMDYELDPGEYTVVGIYCAAEREGPECFKSNKITITVPSEN